MDLSSSTSTSASSGFMTEPPLSPGTPAATPPPPARIPLSGPPLRTSPRPPQPVLEAQVVRLGLMTPDQVASTMRQEAETGRTFADLAVANGHLTPEDLAKLTDSEEPSVADPVTAQAVAQAPTVASAATAAAAPPTPAPTPAPAAAPPVAPVPAASAPAPAAPAPAAAAAPVSAQPPAPTPEPATSPEPPPAPVAASPAVAKPEPPPVAPAAGPDTIVKAEVFVRLTSRERISAGIFDRQDLAEARARELMGELAGHGSWPSIGGRYVRPDAVVSIDVELTGAS